MYMAKPITDQQVVFKSTAAHSKKGTGWLQTPSSQGESDNLPATSLEHSVICHRQLLAPHGIRDYLIAFPISLIFVDKSKSSCVRLSVVKEARCHPPHWINLRQLPPLWRILGILKVS